MSVRAGLSLYQCMCRGMRKCFPLTSIVSEDKELRKDRGEPGSRLLCGLPATWAANSFKTFWLQSFAMVQARTQANSIGVWVRKSTPLVGPAHEE